MLESPLDARWRVAAERLLVGERLRQLQAGKHRQRTFAQWRRCNVSIKSQTKGKLGTRIGLRALRSLPRNKRFRNLINRLFVRFYSFSGADLDKAKEEYESAVLHPVWTDAGGFPCLLLLELFYILTTKHQNLHLATSKSTKSLRT